MEHVDAKEFEKNPTLEEVVEPENDLKSMLVEYVGNKLNPDDKNVTVGMIIDVVAEEFPDFVMSLAEENWIRGYHQALEDVESGRQVYEEATSDDKQK
jgi:hypothetical protein